MNNLNTVHEFYRTTQLILSKSVHIFPVKLKQVKPWCLLKKFSSQNTHRKKTVKSTSKKQLQRSESINFVV